MSSAQSKGKVNVKISKDKMSAVIKVIPPKPDGIVLTREEILAILEENNVIFGINDLYVESLSKIIKDEIELDIAKGIPPTPGKDATFRIVYKERKDGIKYTEDEEGKIDFKEVENPEIVKKGQMLAEKFATEPGIEGMTVTGEEIPFPAGKDIKLVAGRGTALIDDGYRVIAEQDGKVVVKGTAFEISDILEIKGDVDYSTGNINFAGSVRVSGNVASGFRISADGDIEIMGNVEQAEIIAGGNIYLKGGLYGRGKGRIIAEYDIYIRSSDNCIIEAGKSLYVRQFITGSKVSAAESIIIEDANRGRISGGETTAGKEIAAAELGAPSYTQTVIEIGILPRVRQALKELQQDKERHINEIKKMEPNIKTLKSFYDSGKITDNQKTLLESLLRTLINLKEMVRRLDEKIEFLSERISTFGMGKIKVSKIAYPGVKIITQNTTTALQKEYTRCTFYEKDANLEIGSL